MSDLDLKKAVESELTWEPSVNAAEIGVAAKDGIVTLTGHVSSFWEKFTAERAASRVAGVRAVANELEVRLPTSSQRTDEDIAQAALNALNYNASVPAERIKVNVSKGWVTLEGTVEWYYQRYEAERAIRSIKGVTGVSNLIEVKPQVSKLVVKSAIQDALRRSAEVDASRITVETEGDRVILRGTVRSYAERREAERAAWAAPGVREVDNQISVVGSAAAAAA
jgi:osmotically-inducible protein OsmY